jgi:hypothetical protein
VLGCNILPARILKPTDKAACERAFGVIRSLLFEKIAGYTGVDVADRGADPEGDAALSVGQMEELIAAWVVKIWQNRVLRECPPAWDPDGCHSPNTLFATSFAQAGFAMQLPRPELFYDLLPAHYVEIDARRGVKIKDLWYDDETVLADFRGRPSTRGGKHKDKWLIRRDPRDRRWVYFQDPFTHQWHALRWTGLPRMGQMPAFADARVRELMAKVKACGLRPKTDEELLPVLLELIGGVIPVSQWPTQMSRSRRKEHAREHAQAVAAADDRPADAVSGGGDAEAQLVVARVRWRERAREVQRAVDAERRRRREEAVPSKPRIPPPLGASTLKNNLFMLPAIEQDAADG